MTLHLTPEQLTGLLLFAWVACVAILALFFAAISKKLKYWDLIKLTEIAVEDWEVTPDNYDQIKRNMRTLVRLDCDWKRTEKLHRKFFWKYKAYFPGEIIKDEAKTMV